MTRGTMKTLGTALVAIVALVGLALPGPAPRAEAPPRDVALWLSADIVIAADGALQSIAWRESRVVGKQAAEWLDPIARKWRFEAGRVDGAAVETQTTLTVQLTAIAEPDGSVRLRVEDAYTGASSVTVVPPAFPPEALRDGVNAMLVARVRVAADGPAEILEVQSGDDDVYPYLERQLAKAVRVAIAKWQFRAERVAGHPVATEMRVPIIFCAEPSSRRCRELEAAEDARPRSGPPGTPVPTDSVAKLLTNVRNGSI